MQRAGPAGARAGRARRLLRGAGPRRHRDRHLAHPAGACRACGCGGADRAQSPGLAAAQRGARDRLSAHPGSRSGDAGGYGGPGLPEPVVIRGIAAVERARWYRSRRAWALEALCGVDMGTSKANAGISRLDESTPATRRLLIAVDAERYSAQNDPGQLKFQKDLVEVLKDA